MPLSSAKSSKKKRDPYLSQAVLPGGKRITLLKTLLTSACERNCNYCPFRAGRDFRRETFTPDEMAKTFTGLVRAGIAEGIFLSSGSAGGGIRTQDRMIATAELLRNKYDYKGYIHLKIMPGAEKSQVEKAMRLANRLSINLESPNTARLEKLAPLKLFMEELLQPLRWVEEIRRSEPRHQGWNGAWPSTTTQFVVGAVGESDLELLKTTTYLQQNLHLSRAYYSAFHPVPDTPFESLPAESPARQFRLYQASYLLRDYGFDLEDLSFSQNGFLPLETDPKIAWAKSNLTDQPLEINNAEMNQLLRVPGIGLKSAKLIVQSRRSKIIRNLEELKQLGINPVRLAPYVLLNGRRPTSQLTLW
jgi:predicted DNA-binding helix-hairpin-helix protein